ncbi:uncharacterized protein LOC114520684 [Dendronephthya gigantea]|uniref:uncharacterized protein LOC114520684 n=1 Tax=Dendronephthya gigantea TaxID=151771 RepID=UPI00106A8C9B|nr:uncharacterized protein LOC114520684 [Dendronephthya gigantea]
MPQRYNHMTMSTSCNVNKQRDMKHNAEIYSKINDFQLEFGENLATTTGIKPGDKVLDMGCGTGELTSFLAERVGKEGQVVGVDPDVERISVAIQKHSGTHENLIFKNGDCSSQFPHYNEQYYDIYFSNFVFQWLSAEEKKTFAQSAFKCLKPGGKIAIQSADCDSRVIEQAKNLITPDKLFSQTMNDKTKKDPIQHFVKKSVTETLLQNSGFRIVSSDYNKRSYIFSSANEFLANVLASDYYIYDETKISASKMNEFRNKFANDDGTVSYFHPSIYEIVGVKTR